MGQLAQLVQSIWFTPRGSGVRIPHCPQKSTPLSGFFFEKSQMIETIGYFLTIAIGIVLGLLGGGGSILAVPLLVYFFDIETQLATTYSLFIVGISAVFGVSQAVAKKTIHIKSALIFAIPSIFSLLIVRKIVLPKIPNSFILINEFVILKNTLLITIFAILMIVSATFMIRKKTIESNMDRLISYQKLSVIGFCVGNIIGLLGAGGGFLIVPALVFFAKLDMKQAVATSLLIIAINSLIGFGSDIVTHVPIDFRLLSKLAALAILGMFIGSAVAKKISSAQLKPIFGWFVLLMGIAIVAKEFFK